jgi:nuclear GTP-binding protein
LRQFGKLHPERKQITVGLVGYPNVGKSSIINTLKSKKVCNVAPVPGETKVWQYITLMKKLYLIDCPGIVQPNKNDSQTDIVLKGVVRIENINQPEDYIPAVLERCKKEYLKRTYQLVDWDDATDFLTQLAVRGGKLLKGGEADMDTVAKMVLNDWIRGKIPFYVAPPERDGEDEAEGEGENQEKVQSPVEAAVAQENSEEQPKV